MVRRAMTSVVQATPRFEEAAATRWFRRTIVPVLLLVSAPPFVMLLWFTHVHFGGSLLELWRHAAAQGLATTIAEAWAPVALGSRAAWTLLAVFAALQLALMRLLPGRRVEGPVTPTGHVP